MKKVKEEHRNPDFSKIPNCQHKMSGGGKCCGVGAMRLITKIEYNCGEAGSGRLFGDTYICDYVCGEHARRKLAGMKRINPDTGGEDII